MRNFSPAKKRVDGGGGVVLDRMNFGKK